MSDDTDKATDAASVADILKHIGGLQSESSPHTGCANALADRIASRVALARRFQYQGNEAHPIAEALAARGIPFVFSTGYGKQSLRAPYSDRPALQKPFKRHDLQKLLAELSF